MAGVNECVGHERVKCYTDKSITLWGGNDDECHDSRWKYGATGVISVASNLVPRLVMSSLYGNCLFCWTTTLLNITSHVTYASDFICYVCLWLFVDYCSFKNR
jgi:hypothetical protein